MALSQDFLYQLKQANPIDSIMSSYVHLKRSSHNYVCLCPFHSEKSPSCTVYNDTQSFYCFGCGAGGDVITFIMKIENLDYIEAVKYLAEKANMAMPENEYQDKLSNLRKKIYEINIKTANYFYKQFKTDGGKIGLKYFIDRGLLPATIKKYGLGYAPDSWSSLKNYLLSEGYSEDEIVSAGVCAKSRSGNVYDVFRKRVMFPIIDLRGNIIAFGGRKIDNDDDRSPKYLNSSDTPIFKKSKNLFSLNFAKSNCESRLILAEGYMDVISVNQAGFPNVVATLGTALTPEQARIMANYSKEIIIAYDADGPGQKAAKRAITLLGEVGVETKVIKMTDAKDPDEYIKKFGATRFKLLLDNSIGAINFELSKCKTSLDMDTDVGRVEYLKRATIVLSEILTPVEREVYISKVANELKVSKEIITSDVNAKIKKRAKTKDIKKWREITSTISTKRDSINPEASKYPKEARAESFIISYLFHNPDKAETIAKKLPSEKFVTSFNRKIYTFMLNNISYINEIDLSLFNSEFSPDEMGKISEMIIKSKQIDINEQSIEDYINVLISRGNHIDMKGEEMSDEDFLDFCNTLKSIK